MRIFVSELGRILEAYEPDQGCWGLVVAWTDPNDF